MSTCDNCGAKWNPEAAGNTDVCPNCIATGRIAPEKEAPPTPAKLKPWPGRGEPR